MTINVPPPQYFYESNAIKESMKGYSVKKEKEKLTQIKANINQYMLTSPKNAFNDALFTSPKPQRDDL